MGGLALRSFTKKTTGGMGPLFPCVCLSILKKCTLLLLLLLPSSVRQRSKLRKKKLSLSVIVVLPACFPPPLTLSLLLSTSIYNFSFPCLHNFISRPRACLSFFCCRDDNKKRTITHATQGAKCVERETSKKEKDEESKARTQPVPLCKGQKHTHTYIKWLPCCMYVYPFFPLLSLALSPALGKRISLFPLSLSL